MVDLSRLDKQLEQLSQEIESIAMHLLSNEKLRKLIGNMSDNPLSADAPSVEEVFNDVLGFLPIFKKTDEKLNRINIIVTDVSNLGEIQTDYMEVGLRIDFLIPENKWKIPSYIRPLLIMSEIERSISGYKIADLGSLEFDVAELIIPNDGQAGYSMLYKIQNFK